MVIASLAGVATGGQPAVQAGSPASASVRQHATPRLQADRAAIRPGGEVMLALRFEIEREWHLYWPGLNDTGLPPTIRLTLPPGFIAKEPLWPAPARHVSTGGIVDHIYEKELVVLIPVSVPGNAGDGTAAEFSIESDWLVCSNVCVPESGAVNLSVPVGVEEVKSPQWQDIEKAKGRLARPLSEAGGRVVATADKRGLRVSAPGAVMISFFPAEDSLPPMDIARDGEVKGSSLSVALAPAEGGTDKPPHIKGIIAVSIAGEAGTRHYTVDLPIR